MSPFLKPHFDTEGPFGLPMKDNQAKALEERLRASAQGRRLRAAPLLVRARRVGAAAGRARGCLVDHRGVARPARRHRAGARHGRFALPAQPDRHAQSRLRSAAGGPFAVAAQGTEGALCGVKAKTHYPPRPDRWTLATGRPTSRSSWCKAGLLRGKSIGFIPLKLRTPTADEIETTRRWPRCATSSKNGCWRSMRAAFCRCSRTRSSRRCRSRCRRRGPSCWDCRRRRMSRSHLWMRWSRWHGG